MDHGNNCVMFIILNFLFIFLFYSWEYFPHDDARSRAYRWGEDGLLGLTDENCQLCFSLGLWNGKDPILKVIIYSLELGLCSIIIILIMFTLFNCYIVMLFLNNYI